MDGENKNDGKDTLIELINNVKSPSLTSALRKTVYDLINEMPDAQTYNKGDTYTRKDNDGTHVKGGTYSKPDPKTMDAFLSRIDELTYPTDIKENLKEQLINQIKNK